MDVSNSKGFIQLCICNVAVQSGRKGFCNVVVNLCVVVSVNSREQKYQEDHCPCFVMFGNKSGWLIHSAKQEFMLCFFNRLVKEQYQCRKNGYTADNTNDNTLRHNNTKVTSKSKGHNTKCNETGNRGNGASCYRFKGIGNGMPHGTVLLSRESFLILFIAVQKENGVIHCNTKLKDCGKGLCNIGSLAQNNIASQIIKNGKSDTKQEQKRNNKGSACQFQNDQTEHCCDHNVDWQLLHGNVLDIRNNTCHTA